MEDVRRRVAQFLFRSGRRQRFRIYRKLQGMLAMNEALGRALERLWYNVSEMGKNPDKPAAQALREWLNRDRAGETFSEAVVGWVPSAELYMIRAGEESGQLAKALQSIQEVAESTNQMRGAVLHAVSYPLFMIVLLSGILWMFGVNLIENMRKAAPPEVLASMAGLAMVSDFIRTWGLWVAGIFIGALALTMATLGSWTGALRSQFDKFAPWSWYRVWQGSGFLLGMSALLGSQVPLKRALEILEEQSGPWLRERIYSTRQEVLRGRNLGESLRTGKYGFPDPQVALDLEILSERADVGQVIELVTKEWIKEQIEDLRIQAEIARTGGLLLAGIVIAWAMGSILHVTVVISNRAGGGGGGF